MFLGTIALVAGFPLTFLVNVLAVAMAGQAPQLFWLVHIVLAVSITLNWALIGAGVGWLVYLLRSRLTAAPS